MCLEVVWMQFELPPRREVQRFCVKKILLAVFVVVVKYIQCSMDRECMYFSFIV